MASGATKIRKVALENVWFEKPRADSTALLHRIRTELVLLDFDGYQVFRHTRHAAAHYQL
jgi:hypothetical protein